MHHEHRVVRLALIGMIYIGLVIGTFAAQAMPSRSQSSPVAAPGAKGVLATGDDFALFLRDDQRFTSVTVKVDQAGNTHAAYVVAAPPAEIPPATYAFCAAGQDCASRANWTTMEVPFDFPQSVAEVQLQLTAQGQPRLMLRAAIGWNNGSGTKHYYYGECDAGCTTPANWTVGYAFHSSETAATDINDMDQPQRNFALDPQGRPRFMYYDRNYFRDPDHWGGFYTWCDAQCTNRDNWAEAWLLVGSIFEYPALAITSDGNPRIVSQIYGSGDTQGVFYLECDVECDDLFGFSIVQVGTRGAEASPSWDIALDPQNRPRIVMYRGSDLDREKGDRLLYLECNVDCNNAESWTTTDLGLRAGDGQDPDLEIDAQGRARIAWTSVHGNVGFSYCNTSCAQPANWENLYFVDEGDATWREELPQALPFNCDDDVWKPKNTVLSLGAGDVLNIAFDVEVNARCVEQEPGNPTPYFVFRRVWDSVRYIRFGLNGGIPEQPTASPSSGPGGQPQIFLPALRR
jgi:hypothetical protein